MERPTSIPEAIWQAIPADVRPAIGAIVLSLEARVAALEARLKQDSSNSSKPPSSDPPGRKRKPPAAPSGLKRGGQPGHPRHERPAEEPDRTVECRPERCAACDAPLAGDDPDPARRLVTELPPITPEVVEYRLHSLACRRCGAVTAGVADAGAAAHRFGPRLTAVVGLLSGVYRLAKRPVRRLLQDVCGLSIATGTVCKMQRRVADRLAPVWNAARDHVRTGDANLDETGWREGRERAWLWVAVASEATVFRLDRSRGRAALEGLVGTDYDGVATCDRWSAYGHLARVQWCWAHLVRDFQAMVDRGGKAEPVGEALLAHAGVLFEWWRRVRDGTLARSTFRRYVGLLRPAFEHDLAVGAAGGCAKTAATCRNLLAGAGRLWLFARRDGVEPTNNAAERAVRHAVLWRKGSFGTDGDAGSRFVERILTVHATCRQQGRDVLGYLTDAMRLPQAPSLLPSG